MPTLLDKKLRSNKDFPSALKDLIRWAKEKGDSQEKIAVRMGIKRQRLMQYVTDQKRANINTMIKLADAFEVSPMYFMDYRLWVLNQAVKKNPDLYNIIERTTGFEPATNSLEGCDSTNCVSTDQLNEIIAEAQKSWVKPEKKHLITSEVA